MDLNKETCLVSSDSENLEDAERPIASNYSFLSECFYMGHRAFDLGYRVIVDKLLKLHQVRIYFIAIQYNSSLFNIF